ncbi:MAG: anthrone oxygenase family protein [Planctomycetota bacterium]
MAEELTNPVVLVALAALLGVALTGGGLYAFSTFIMSALARMPDAQGARAMQHINKTVFTPWFIGPFFVTAPLSIAAIVMGVLNTDQPWALSLIAAGALYLIGVFAATVIGNVPLNEKLDHMDAGAPETAEFWRRYLRVWTRWNHVRSAASALSILFFAYSLVHL